jgi:hypothetical protein
LENKLLFEAAFEKMRGSFLAEIFESKELVLLTYEWNEF